MHGLVRRFCRQIGRREGSIRVKWPTKMKGSGSEQLRPAAAGDDRRQALSQLYDRYAGGLYAYACVLARSLAEAEDAVQECFARLAERPGRLKDVENPRGYLFRMLRNECFRGRSRWLRWWRQDLVCGTARFDGEVHGGEDSHLRAEEVQRAVDALPPTQREVVFLKVWQEMTFAEIGEVLGISPNTAASRYRYGIEKLRERLRDE